MWRRLATSAVALLVAWSWAIGLPAIHGERRHVAQPLDLGRAERLLVVVPHPDDEVVGAGSLLVHARTALVVVLTSGDANVAAAAAETPWATRRGDRFRRLGARRLVEFRQALATLAPGAETVALGYPDRSLARLLSTHLRVAHRSPYTGMRSVPYRAAGHGEPHTGEALVERLERLMIRWRPDVVALPSAFDRHPDHEAAAAFVRLAASRLPDPPRLLEYLVHAPGWPEPAGLTPATGLRPPKALARDAGLTWYRDVLTPHERLRLVASLLRHATQMRVMGPFLLSFVKANGLYASSAPLVPGRAVCEPLPSRSPLGGRPRRICLGLDRKGMRLRVDGWPEGAVWRVESVARSRGGLQRRVSAPTAAKSLALPRLDGPAVVRVRARLPERREAASSWRSLRIPSGPRAPARA
jgi:LmbE family N-acetylglucosaminyl deacetylase